jgi:luciferase family oxidoreductase group 1
MTDLQIGIIEFGYHKPGLASMNVLDEVINYTIKADELGFSRLWFTEHHDYFKTSPWSNPEILLPLFLAMTSRIKIGQAGILANYHSPYNVAMNFKLLANLFPGRVDLGFANGSPPEYAAKMLLQRRFRKRPKNFHKNAKMVSEYFYNEEEIGLKNEVTIPPVAGLVPDLFLLGSFFHSTDFALKWRMNYSKSLFHDIKSMINESDKVKAFREDFYNRYSVLPQVNITVPIVCGESVSDAERIETESGHPAFPNTIKGCMERVSDELRKTAEMFAVDEVVIFDRSFDSAIKLETLEKLKEKFAIN